MYGISVGQNITEISPSTVSHSLGHIIPSSGQYILGAKASLNKLFKNKESMLSVELRLFEVEPRVN
jgi:hypothetical protein